MSNFSMTRNFIKIQEHSLKVEIYNILILADEFFLIKIRNFFQGLLLDWLLFDTPDNLDDDEDSHDYDNDDQQAHVSEILLNEY